MAIVSLPRRIFLRNAAVACAVAPALQPTAAISAETRVQVPMAAAHDFKFHHDGLTLEYDPTDREPVNQAHYVKDGRLVIAYLSERNDGSWATQMRSPDDKWSRWEWMSAHEFPARVDGRLTAIRFSV